MGQSPEVPAMPDAASITSGEIESCGSCDYLAEVFVELQNRASELRAKIAEENDPEVKKKLEEELSSTTNRAQLAQRRFRILAGYDKA